RRHTIFSRDWSSDVCSSDLKGPGDALIGASLNTSGSLVMAAARVGSDTVLAQIVQMVAQAQRSRAPMQRLADVVAGYFVLAVVEIGRASCRGRGRISMTQVT